MLKSLRSKKGFTLLELIVVVVVLGILAALAIPSFSSVKQSAADKVAVQSAEGVVRNAEALAAFEGAALNDTYVDAAGAEVTGYNSGTNTVTITSGGKTGAASIDATTGAVTIVAASNTGGTGNGGGGTPHTTTAVIEFPSWYESQAPEATNISYSGTTVSFSVTSTINFDPSYMHVAMRNVSNPSQSAWLNNTAAGISIVRPADNQYTVSVDIAAITGGTVNFSDLTDVAFNLNMGSMTMSRSFRFTN